MNKSLIHIPMWFLVAILHTIKSDDFSVKFGFWLAFSLITVLCLKINKLENGGK